MSKPRSLLAGLKAAITPNTVPDWQGRTAAAEHDLSTAQDAHGNAALEAQQDLPGAAERLVRAVEVLQAAQSKIANVRAAQRAWEAQEAERRAKTTAAQAEREDQAARAAFAHLAAVAAKGEAILASYHEWWAELYAADQACRTHVAGNVRTREDLTGYSLADLVSREIARRASTKPLPPGANALAAEISDRRSWEPLSKFFADVAHAILPAKAKPKAA